MRPLLHHTAALAACGLAALLGCARPADPGPAPEPPPIVMHPVEPAPMPGWAQWMPVSDFPGVERGGSFAHDVGMMWDGVRVGGKYYRQDAMAPVVLATAGWATASVAERQAIAERYCRGLLDWRIVWDLEHTDWEPGRAGRFTPAAATVREGAVVFTAWIDATFVGMRPPAATEYRKVEAVFERDGRVAVRMLERYDAPRRRS